MIKLNVAAEETVRMESPRYAALFWEMRAISAEAQLTTVGSVRATRTALAGLRTASRAAVASLISRLYAAEETRAHVERPYLEGVLTLFPVLATDWLVLREEAEQLAGLGDVLPVTVARIPGARRDRGSSLRRPMTDVRDLRAISRDRAPDDAASLVDAARAAALDVLGDTDGAATIAERRLRAGL